MKIETIEDMLNLDNIIASDTNKIERINKAISSVDISTLDNRRQVILKQLLIERKRLINEINELRKDTIESIFSSSREYTSSESNEFSMNHNEKVKSKKEV